MKYIKEYKEIDFDEFDIEEEDPNKPPDDFIGYEGFYVFLEENDVVDSLIKEYNKQKYSLGNPPEFSKFLHEYKIDDIRYMLMDMFDWHESELGVDYWYNLSKKWGKYNNQY